MSHDSVCTILMCIFHNETECTCLTVMLHNQRVDKNDKAGSG